MGFQKLQYVISNTLFHKEAGLLHSQLTSGDCFLLEMAQGGLAFGAALPDHQRGVQDLVSNRDELACGVEVGLGTCSVTMAFAWYPILTQTYLVWNRNRTPREQPSMQDLWSLWLRPGQNQKRKAFFSLLTLDQNEA